MKTPQLKLLSMLLSLGIIVFVEETAAEIQCESGWARYESSCYYVEDDATASWDVAENSCIELGGHLVSIHSDGERDFINEQTSQNAHWIGLKRDVVLTSFRWSDETDKEYDQWALFTPYVVPLWDCVYADASGRSWYNGLYLTRLRYICKKPGVDYCSPDPCENGGTCVDEVNGYSCSCDPGFTGDNCETDIDDCSPNPCKNEGICIDGVNAFSCSCIPGFNGETCENNIDDCEVEPCLNGGECTDFVNGFSCACADGYTGNACETQVQCKSGWVRNGLNCYYFHHIPTATWDWAESSCVDRGGHLASIHNNSERDFINSKLLLIPYWIGLRENESDKVFQWSDGTTVGNTYWYFGHPDTFSWKCVTLLQLFSLSHSWAEAPCYTLSGFVCKSQEYETSDIAA